MKRNLIAQAIARHNIGIFSMSTKRRKRTPEVIGAHKARGRGRGALRIAATRATTTIRMNLRIVIELPTDMALGFARIIVRLLYFSGFVIYRWAKLVT